MKSQKIFKDLKTGDKIYSYTQDKIQEFTITCTEKLTLNHTKDFSESFLRIKCDGGYTFRIPDGIDMYHEYIVTKCFDCKFGMSITATSTEAIYEYLQERYDKDITDKERAMNYYDEEIARAKNHLENFEYVLNDLTK